MSWDWRIDHVIRRARERIGLFLTEDEVAAIEAQVRNEGGPRVQIKDDTVALATQWRGLDLIVVLNLRGLIVTVLHPDQVAQTPRQAARAARRHKLNRRKRAAARAEREFEREEMAGADQGGRI